MLVRRCVGDVETQQPHVDFVEGFAPAENVEKLLFSEGRLLLDVEACEHHGLRVAESARLVQRDLERVWRWTASGAADADTVLTLLVQADGVEMGHHVWAEIGGFGDFVEQLGGDRPHRDQPTGIRMLRDHR